MAMVDLMRIQFDTNAGGEFKLSLLPDKPKQPKPRAQDAANLVYCPKVQDRIYPPRNCQPVGFGRLGNGQRFTQQARRRLRECGAILDNGDLRSCVFLTGTLPGGTPAAKLAIARYSSWVTSVISQWLRDRHGDPQAFGVWEYQKRGALHLHVCVRVANIREAWKLKQAWKTRWMKCLDFIGQQTGVDLYQRQDGGTWETQRWKTRTDAQTVERSVSRYLSKYCGKTADKRRQGVKTPPASWWFASKNLRVAAKSQRGSLIVPSLSHAQAVSLFEQIAGRICPAASVIYAVCNKYDLRQQCLIGFSPPAIIGMLQRVVSVIGRASGPLEYADLAKRLASAASVRALFDGRLFVAG